MQQERNQFHHPMIRGPEFPREIPESAQCADILRAHLDEVIQSFLSAAQSGVPAASGKDTGIILDSLPIYLEHLIRALDRREKNDVFYQISKICEDHGKQRATLTNYTLDQVLYEYALLRRIILSSLRKHAVITVEESDVIHEVIQEGMIQAGSEFAKAQTRAHELLEKEKKSLSVKAYQYSASLSALLASSPVGIAFLDRDLRYLQINEPLAELNGVPIEQHIGRTVRELLPEDAKFLEPVLEKVVDLKEPVLNIELTAKRKGGGDEEGRHVLANYFPVQSESGESIGVGAVVVDVTDIFRAQEALRESEELRTRILESSEDCFKILDLEGKLLVLTEFSKQHLEIEDPSPLIGKSWFRFWSRPEDDRAAKEAVRKAALGGKGHFVGYYPTPSGKRKWWDILVTPMRDKNGKPEKLLAVSRDITALWEAEEALKGAKEQMDQALRQSLQTFKEMTDSLPVLFWWTDEGGKGNHFNKKYYEYTGLPDSYNTTSKENFHPIVHPDDLAENLKVREEALRKKETARFEERLRRWDGEFRWHLVHVTPVFFEDGRLKRWYATSIDIHERKIAEIEKIQAAESLKTQTEKLSSKNVELDRFAAIAAHDLKSPLNSMTQFSQLLAELYRGRLDESADQYIDFIVNAGKRMTDLIDNLLEFARAGALDRSRLTSVSVAEVMETVRSNLLSEIDRTKAQITMNPHLPAVQGKQLQMIQLFQNLIANSIKFHKPHQPPKIHIDFSDKGECWCFLVADEGIGMDPSHSQKIFEIFSRLSDRGHYEGSGIGLAVCKRIVEAHGGRIHFHSEPDRGATFYFTLPKAHT